MPKNTPVQTKKAQPKQAKKQKEVKNVENTPPPAPVPVPALAPAPKEKQVKGKAAVNKVKAEGEALPKPDLYFSHTKIQKHFTEYYKKRKEDLGIDVPKFSGFPVGVSIFLETLFRYILEECAGRVQRDNSDMIKVNIEDLVGILTTTNGLKSYFAHSLLDKFDSDVDYTHSVPMIGDKEMTRLVQSVNNDIILSERAKNVLYFLGLEVIADIKATTASLLRLAKKKTANYKFIICFVEIKFTGRVRTALYNAITTAERTYAHTDEDKDKDKDKTEDQNVDKADKEDDSDSDDNTDESIKSAPKKSNKAATKPKKEAPKGKKNEVKQDDNDDDDDDNSSDQDDSPNAKYGGLKGDAASDADSDDNSEISDESDEEPVPKKKSIKKKH